MFSEMSKSLWCKWRIGSHKRFRLLELSVGSKPDNFSFAWVNAPLASMSVITGSVRLVRVDRAGREAVLHVAAAGETLAEASLFVSAYHCDAIAMTGAVVRLYPKALVLREFEHNPKAAQAFMAMLAQRVMNLRAAP